MESEPLLASSTKRPLWTVLIAGATAGLVVDTSLYPIDTIKSRLQSKAGLLKTGGFSNLYRGLSPVLLGSVPNAALFFLTYEGMKKKLEESGRLSNLSFFTHILAASTARSIVALEGVSGLYRGFTSTVARDIPFSAIEFPVWEYLKSRHLDKYKQPCSATQSALYGSIAGALAAFLTNPLDVAKTRIMLADSRERLATGQVLAALQLVRGEKGIRGLFAGVVPRVLWITAGAAIFFGSYEKVIKLL